MTEIQGQDLTVIMVSYNTRELTLKSLETLYENAGLEGFRTIVWDNDSKDGSAEAIARAFPQVEVVHCPENLGFAKANNKAIEQVTSDWVLLLNPDTEVYPDAIRALLSFSKKHPEAGITGGRTVFPDGSLNIASCWQKITVWSVFCHATCLTTVFPESPVFNREALGGWQRDSVRQVDIVSGCFFMLRTELWRELRGFNLKYVMYGEEADMCLRAAKLGYKPMITPDAQIMHLVGASSAHRADKTILVTKARVTLMKDHWPSFLISIGMMLMWVWISIRYVASTLLRMRKKGDGSPHQAAQHWKEVWQKRKTWFGGY